MARMDMYQGNLARREEYRAYREPYCGRSIEGSRQPAGTAVRRNPARGETRPGRPGTSAGRTALRQAEVLRKGNSTKGNPRRRRKKERTRRALAGLMLYFMLAGIIATGIAIGGLFSGFFSGKEEKVHAAGGQTAEESAENIRTMGEAEAEGRSADGDTVSDKVNGGKLESGGTINGVSPTEVTPETRQECQKLYADQQSLLVLVNKEHELPITYEAGLRNICHGRLRAADVLYDDLCAMLKDGKEAGYEYWIASAGRDRTYQQGLVDEDVENYMAMGYSYEAALEKTYEYTMPAGKSEHETGLALDILCSTNTLMDESQAGEPGNRWLALHCHEYGFILRYPKEKEEITGIQYEPWHFRYVGREAAAYLAEKGWTLEEFYEAAGLGQN